jgi:hypothetical protein
LVFGLEKNLKKKIKKVKFSIQVPIELGYMVITLQMRLLALEVNSCGELETQSVAVRRLPPTANKLFFLHMNDGKPFNSLFCVQINCNDKPIETQHFSENEDQNHSYKEAGLLGCPADAGVTDDTNGEPSGQPAESYGQPRAQVNKSPENKNKWYIAATHLTFIFLQ